MDVRVLKDLVGDDTVMITGLLHDFRMSALKIGAEILKTLDAGRTGETGAAAHKLKSSARSVGALRLGQLCEQIEQAGKAGDNPALAELTPLFEAELIAVDNYLVAWPGEPVRQEEEHK